MEHRWQVLNKLGGAEDWVDAEPPIDGKVLDLAAQVIELENRLKYQQEQFHQFYDDIWKALKAKGEWGYPGEIIIETTVQTHNREKALGALKDAPMHDAVQIAIFHLKDEG